MVVVVTTFSFAETEMVVIKVIRVMKVFILIGQNSKRWNNPVVKRLMIIPDSCFEGGLESASFFQLHLLVWCQDDIFHGLA
jgi:hypothetical protein